MDETPRIICIKKRQSYDKQCDDISKYKVLDVTSHNSNKVVAEALSPLWLDGGVSSDGDRCKRFENLWQYTKVYSEHIASNGDPNEKYWQWRKAGFSNTGKGVRFPFGKPRKPEYAYWMINGEWHKLGYLDARKIIYIPEYAKLVSQTEYYKELKKYFDAHPDVKLALVDFDAYNNHKLGMSMVDVFNCNKKAGHAFVIKMLLEGDIEVINGEVIDHIGVLKTDLCEQINLF